MLIIAAFAAGVLTTVAGMGGGTLLVLLVLLVVEDPVAALAATSMGLLVGNVHRTLLFRHHLRREVLLPFVLGATPAAVLGGWLVTSAPAGLVRGAIGAVAVVAIVSIVAGVRIRPAPGASVAMGALTGGVSATTGGGGLIAGPFFLATGLSAERYIATGAAAAVCVHTGRLFGYGSGGAVDVGVLVLGAGFAVAIPLGNLAGKRIRPLLSMRVGRGIELGTAGALGALAVANAM